MKAMIALAATIGRSCKDRVIVPTCEARPNGTTRPQLLQVLAVAIETPCGPGMVDVAKPLEALSAHKPLTQKIASPGPRTYPIETGPRHKPARASHPPICAPPGRYPCGTTV